MSASGSITSGVDGSSEGGRINSIQAGYLLELYGVSLVNVLHDSGEHGQMKIEPIQVDGIWCLELTVGPGFKSPVPTRWHGRRVIIRYSREALEKPFVPGTLGGFTPPPAIHPDEDSTLPGVAAA